jgi:predicted HTH transcriptional regulator
VGTVEVALEEQKKLWGSDIVNKASANLERNQKADFVSVIDEQTGKEKQYKRTVADVLLAKKDKKYSLPRMVFTVPDLSHIDWSN